MNGDVLVWIVIAIDGVSFAVISDNPDDRNAGLR